MSVHFKNKENVLLVQDTVYSHNQQLLILKAGQDWHIRQQLSVRDWWAGSTWLQYQCVQVRALPTQ
jgi:hypothetical protein